MRRTLMPRWTLLCCAVATGAPLGCNGGKDGDTDTADTAADSGDSNESDTAESDTAESDTAESDTSDTDTGETGDTATTFAAVTSAADLVEATDVVATGTDIYVVGFNADGDAAVVRVDPTSGAVTALFAGAPLVQPSGLALAEDGATLYVADVAAPNAAGVTNGAVYSLPSGGGALTELAGVGTIDLPGDVAVAHGGSSVYVSGFTTAGLPAIFAVTLSGSVSVAASGAPLVEPLALAASPDGEHLYVADAMASGAGAAILRYDLPDFHGLAIADGFSLAFPGGVAVSPDSSLVYTTAVGDPALIEMSPDGTGMTVLDTMGLLELPAGVGAVSEGAYVTELSRQGDADLYLLTY